MNAEGPVLISWVAYNNDPFERKRDRTYELIDGSRIPGPTLTLLFDPESRYCQKIKHAVLLFNKNDKDKQNGSHVFQETKEEIQKIDSQLTVEYVQWSTDDPTDYKAIYDFLSKTLPRLRNRFKGREFIIHISPGTPAMQTIWVLMAETGLIEPPYSLVKSAKRKDRKSKNAVSDVKVGIETFYKLFKGSLPKYTSSDDQAIPVDPSKFQSARMQTVFHEARRFAQLKAPILILGPRGTGKTTLASWIRACSPFRKPALDKEWLAVPCGQYTAGTMRAELFGYRKGAFTDAKEDKEGVIAQADGDTLFLDEIGDMSRDLQRLLIKALEEKRFYRLGDTKALKSDFRLISATNIPLSMLREKLDPDFFDRICTFQIELPPLRNIPEDIPMLWESVFEEAAKRAGVQAPELNVEISKALTKALRSINLSGNIRDLFRIAYHLLAGINDPEFHKSPLDIVEYAVGCIEYEPETPGSDIVTAKRIAKAFTENQNLFYSAGIDRLNTKSFEKLIKNFMARELFHEARKRKIPVGDLCDVTERALLNWRNNPKEKYFS